MRKVSIKISEKEEGKIITKKSEVITIYEATTVEELRLQACEIFAIKPQCIQDCTIFDSSNSDLDLLSNLPKNQNSFTMKISSKF
jgi:hypothetical protein